MRLAGLGISEPHLFCPARRHLLTFLPTGVRTFLLEQRKREPWPS